MTAPARDWPWWTPAAAIVGAIAFSCAVWLGVAQLSSVAVDYASAKSREGTWSRQAFFGSARDLATGRSVSKIKTAD